MEILNILDSDFILVHAQNNPERPELTTKFLINPNTDQTLVFEFVNN